MNRLDGKAIARRLVVEAQARFGRGLTREELADIEATFREAAETLGELRARLERGERPDAAKRLRVVPRHHPGGGRER